MELYSVLGLVKSLFNLKKMNVAFKKIELV